MQYYLFSGTKYSKQTWNLLEPHKHCPCKMFTFWRYAVGCKFTIYCSVHWKLDKHPDKSNQLKKKDYLYIQ